MRPQLTSITAILAIAAMLSTDTIPHAAASSVATSGTVVQFVVYAEEQADVTRVFPGAYVDFTWNNVFVVSIWTNDAPSLIPDIQKALHEHEAELQTLVPPYTMAAATQKWLEYNLIWVCMLVLIFVAGCVCGGLMLNKCNSIKQAQHHRIRTCHTRF